MLANLCVKTPTEETKVCGQCHKHQPDNYIFSQYFHFPTDKDVFLIRLQKKWCIISPKSLK